MNGFAGKRVAVFHAGALGDCVLTWPLLRALRRGGADVTLVAAESHAALAVDVLGIRGVCGEQSWVRALWRDEDAPDSARPRGMPALDVVVSLVVDERSGSGRAWERNARAMLGVHEVVIAGRPGEESRARLWERAQVRELGAAEPRTNPDGPIVLHAGAGSRAKMWPIERWARLAATLRSRGVVHLIAGEVEQERFVPDERTAFLRAGGRFLHALPDLADTLRDARAFVGADTGPTHLAAQLGLPTLAMFGPTDPAVWSPVGPTTRVLHSQNARMEAIQVDDVLRAIDAWRAEPPIQQPPNHAPR